MKNNKFLIIMSIIIISLLAIIFIFNDDKDQYLKEITLEEYKELVTRKESFMLYVKQTNCSHCKEFTPEFTSVLNKYKIYSYVVNLTNLTNKDATEFFNITGVDGTPTVLFYENGEQSSTQIEGVKSKSVITSKLKVMGYIKGND